jgi:hypothetical protein
MHAHDISFGTWSALAAGVCVFLRPGIASAEQQLICPTVQSSQVRVSSPAGWTGLYRAPVTLPPKGAEAIFVFGSLREPWGEMHPEIERKKDGSVINRYLLSGAPSPVPLQKWMVCHYGEGIYQATQLPAETKECAMTYRRVQNPLEPKKKLIDVLSNITCK